MKDTKYGTSLDHDEKSETDGGLRDNIIIGVPRIRVVSAAELVQQNGTVAIGYALFVINIEFYEIYTQTGIKYGRVAAILFITS